MFFLKETRLSCPSLSMKWRVSRIFPTQSRRKKLHFWKTNDVVFNPLLQKLKLSSHVWKMCKDCESSYFFSVAGHLLRSGTLSSLILLESCDCCPFLWHISDHQVGFRSFLISFIHFAASINREKEDDDNFSR